MDEKTCPICNSGDAKFVIGDPIDAEDPVDCPTCGKFRLVRPVSFSLGSYESAVVSHNIRRMQNAANKNVLIGSDLMKEWRKRDLPQALDQLNNLILWIGDATSV